MKRSLSYSLAALSASLLVSGCVTPIQAELDAEVKRLCAIDGGIRVFETVALPSAGPNDTARPNIPAKELAGPKDEYFFESDTRYYRKGDPEMWRAEYRVIRARDRKVLGISVTYVRRGGDVPSPKHESSLACPPTGSQTSLVNAIFIKADVK